MKWLCLSGWAVRQGQLESLLSCQGEEIDYSFYSKNAFPSIEKFIPNEPYSILCYSMGTIHALQAAKIRSPEKIVSIAGFAHFPGYAKDAKMRRMLIMKMMKGLKTAPKKTLEDFSNKAGLPQFSFEGFNIANLSKGLELLKDCDMSQALNKQLNITLIASENDEIVPAHISEQLMQGPGVRETISIPGPHGAWFSRREELQKILE